MQIFITNIGKGKIHYAQMYGRDDNMLDLCSLQSDLNTPQPAKNIYTHTISPLL